jgi:polyisoprenoid-binding protein YceI
MLKDGVFLEGKCLKFALSSGGALACAVLGASLLRPAAAASPPQAAAPRTLALTPATAKLGLTVYALGFIPVTGNYPRFSGTIDIDPAHPDFCRVLVTVDQASLDMGDPTRTRHALAPDMLDAAKFPTMRYAGDCRGDAIEGVLTLHGITHPLSMSLRRSGTKVSGEGRLMRQDYGIDGMPHLLGQGIRIHFSTTLPMP